MADFLERTDYEHSLRRKIIQRKEYTTVRNIGLGCRVEKRSSLIVQSFCGKKSVNLQLIATEGISTVLDLENYP